MSWDISPTDLGEGEDNEVDDEEDGEVVGCLCLCVFVCEEDPLAPGGEGELVDYLCPLSLCLCPCICLCV